MKSIRFGNKTVHQITAKEWQDDIRQIFRKRLDISISDMGYQYLNEKTQHLLKRNDGKNYHIAINTFGVKNYLYLTTYQSKDYNIFINKKNEDMIIVDLEFPKHLYNNTIFEGELVKDSSGKWIFVISDILLYNDINVRKEYPFQKRNELLRKIMEAHKPTEKDYCQIEQKEYFTMEYLKDLTESYIPMLPYKVSGIFFQEETDYKRSLMFIFPENRTNDQKKAVVPLGSTATETQPSEQSIIDTSKPAVFEVVKTSMPDIYELHLNSSKQGYAMIPDMATSQRLNDIFKNEQKRMMLCKFNEKFQKWVPMDLAV